mmetsp:Transcript_34193/g.62679  ORF Transcript_34193/g.62679 Transcript_34193/m.62679 type:complete len:91 (-) Transcript_34193:2073-2345(-)
MLQPNAENASSVIFRLNKLDSGRQSAKDCANEGRNKKKEFAWIVPQGSTGPLAALANTADLANLQKLLGRDAASHVGKANIWTEREQQLA